MAPLVLLGLVGFGAQMINSGLGMGYGVTTTSSLLALGATPALASATVNVSQVGSQLVSGFAHWRFGNVDWPVVWRIGLPGAAGAFAGASFLSWLTVEAAGPLMAVVLLALGGYLLLRFTTGVRPAGSGPDAGHPGRPGARFLVPVGLLGGFLNSAAGGGWGPVGTSALLVRGRTAPRTVIGSISAAEFLVVTAGSVGFLTGLGLAGIEFGWVAALLAGGVVAAPVAAWLARRVPARLLGVLVGGLIVVTNARTLLHLLGAPVPVTLSALTLALAGWAAAIGLCLRAGRAAGRIRAWESRP